MQHVRPIHSSCLLKSRFMLALMLALGSCGGSDRGGSVASGLTGAPVTTYVNFVRGNGVASVARGNGAFESSFQVINEAQGGMAFDYLGNLYQADIRLDGGTDEVGAIQIISQASRRSFEQALDGGAQSSTDLRGIALLPGDTGTGLVVSDFGVADGALYVFDEASAADLSGPQPTRRLTWHRPRRAGAPGLGRCLAVGRG